MGEDQDSFASKRLVRKRSLVNDTSARVPFAFIAVLIMIMASFSAAYLSSVNNNEILSHVENLEIQKMDDLSDAIRGELTAHAYSLAVDCIRLGTQDASGIERNINELFCKGDGDSDGNGNEGSFDRFLTTNYPRIVGDYQILVTDYFARVIIEEKETIDLASQSVIDQETTRGFHGVVGVVDTTSGRTMMDTSTMAYYTVLGYVNITITKLNDEHIYETTLDFDEDLRCPYPFLNNKFNAFADNAEGETTELARMIKYILTTMAQYRALQGHGMKDLVDSISTDPSTGTGILDNYPGRDDIITNDDVELAVNIAVILELARMYRTYDEESLVELESKYGSGGIKMSELVDAYVTVGTIDAADIIALFNGYAQDASGVFQGAEPLDPEAVIAQSVNAIVDQFTLRYLEAFHIMPVVDAAYYGIQELDDITDEIMDWFIDSSYHDRSSVVHDHIKGTFGEAGLSNTHFVQPYGWPDIYDTFQGQVINGYPKTPAGWHTNDLTMNFRVRETEPGGSSSIGNKWYSYPCGHNSPNPHLGYQGRCTVQIETGNDKEGVPIMGICGANDVLWGYDDQDYTLKVAIYASEEDMGFYMRDILSPINDDLWADDYYPELRDNTENTMKAIEDSVKEIIMIMVNKMINDPSLQAILDNERILTIDPKDQTSMLENININVGDAVGGVVEQFKDHSEKLLIDKGTGADPVKDMYLDMKAHLEYLIIFMNENYDDLVGKDELIRGVATTLAEHLTDTDNGHFSFWVQSEEVDMERAMSTQSDKSFPAEVTSATFASTNTYSISNVNNHDVSRIFRNGGAIQSPLLNDLIEYLIDGGNPGNPDGVVTAAFEQIKEREITLTDKDDIIYRPDQDGVVIQALSFFMMESIAGTRSIPDIQKEDVDGYVIGVENEEEDGTEDGTGTENETAKTGTRGGGWDGQDPLYQVGDEQPYDVNGTPVQATATGPGTRTSTNTAMITYTHTGSPTSVEIYWTTDGGSVWNLWGTDISIDGSWNGGVITSDLVYHWNVRARGDFSNESVPSGPASIEAGPHTYDPTPPWATATGPIFLTSTGTNLQPTVTYSWGEEVDSVEISYSIDGGSWTSWGTDVSVDGSYQGATISNVGNPAKTIYWNARAIGWESEAGGLPEAGPYYYDIIKPKGSKVITDKLGPLAHTYTDIIVNFDEPVIAGAFSWSITPSNPGLNVVWNGTQQVIFELEPGRYFNRETLYQITVSVKDRANNDIHPSFDSYQFTTIPYPRVYTTIPADGELNVNCGADIAISFDEIMTNILPAPSIITTVPATAGWTLIWQGTNNGPGTGSTAVFQHPTDFDDGRIYSVSMDLTGFESREYADHARPKDTTPPFADNKYEWSFTTTDITSPEIISTNPIDREIDVPINQNIIIEFSEPVTNWNVYIYEIDTGVFLHREGTSLVTNLSISHDDLLGGETYTVHVYAEDPTGNPLAASSIPDPWSFTTEDASPPILITHTPDSNTVGVPATAPLIFFFDEPILDLSLAYAISPDPGGWSETWNNDRTMVQLHHDDLIPDTAYTVTISSLQDEANNQITTPIIFSFRTAPGSAGVSMGVEDKVWGSVAGGTFGMGDNSLFNMMENYVNTICAEISFSSKMANTKFQPDLMYRYPGETNTISFEFRDNATDPSPDIEAVRVDQEPDWLQPAIIISEPTGSHYINVLEFTSRPYETRWDVVIDGEFELDTWTLNKFFKVSGTHVETRRNGTIVLDINIPITIYSGWELGDDIEYDLAQEDLLEAYMRYLDAFWYDLCELNNWVVDDIFKVTELFSGLVTRFQGEGASQIEALSETIETFMMAMIDASNDDTGLIGDRINGFLQAMDEKEWELTYSGLTMTFSNYNDNPMMEVRHPGGSYSAQLRFADGIVGRMELDIWDLDYQADFDCKTPQPTTSYRTVDGGVMDAPVTVNAQMGGVGLFLEGLKIEKETSMEYDIKAPLGFAFLEFGCSLSIPSEGVENGAFDDVEAIADIILGEGLKEVFDCELGEETELLSIQEFTDLTTQYLQDIWEKELWEELRTVNGIDLDELRFRITLKACSIDKVMIQGGSTHVGSGISIVLEAKDPVDTLPYLLRWLINDLPGIIDPLVSHITPMQAGEENAALAPSLSMLAFSPSFQESMDRMPADILDKLFFEIGLVGTTGGRLITDAKGEAGGMMKYNGHALLELSAPQPSQGFGKGEWNVEFGASGETKKELWGIPQGFEFWLVKGEIKEKSGT